MKDTKIRLTICRAKFTHQIRLSLFLGSSQSEGHCYSDAPAPGQVWGLLWHHRPYLRQSSTPSETTIVVRLCEA